MNHLWEWRLYESPMGAICRGCQGFARGIQGLFSFGRSAICHGCLRALRGAMKTQHLNHKTLEIIEFLVIVSHIVTFGGLCTLNGDLESWRVSHE